MDKEHHDEPWAALYELMGEEVPKNEKERIAAWLLGKGYSLFVAKNRSGLTNEEFRDLYERLGKRENEVMCGDRETFLAYQKKAERMMKMKKIELRFDYIPMETTVYVSSDGKSFEKIVTDNIAEYDDFFCSLPVTPGVSKIRLVNISTDVDHYYWTFSDGEGHDTFPVKDGDDLNSCVITVPPSATDGTTMYIEEDKKSSEYGNDSRDIYFKTESDFLSLNIADFTVSAFQAP